MKKIQLYNLLLVVVTSSCLQLEEPIVPSVLTDFDKETISYFKEIALGFEFGNNSEITRRWETDMKIFVGGEKRPMLIAELIKVMAEINELATTSFSISTVSDSSKCNFYLFLGTGKDYGKLFPSSQTYIDSNLGLFSINWNNQSNIDNGRMYVDIYRANEQAQKHLLREELTQSLGLGKDSFKYPESIFQQNWTTTTSYAAIDKELIRLLYHPEVTSGMDATEVTEVLTTILTQDL